MDFNKLSREAVGQINQELKRLLGTWRDGSDKIDSSLLPLIDKFIKANKGGKRIRGTLVVLGYEIASSEFKMQNSKLKNKEIFKIAAAYEIFHTAILAHDDIVDQSLIRRGQPSLYQALGGDHQGISLAITLADAGFFLAVKVIAESKFMDEEKSSAMKWFSQIILDTSLGQILDIQQGDSLIVAKHKTAKYTIAGPLILGAILSRGSKELLGKLGEFGESLGIAFQIQDDILDAETDWIGGSDCAKKEMERYKDQAIKVLPRITKDKKMSKLLQQLAEYLVERNL